MDNQFMSSYFAIAQPLMGQNAKIPLIQIAKNKGYIDVDSWYENNDTDSIRVAKNENTNILLHGDLDNAQPGENHKAHLSQHEPELAQLALVSKETRAANGIMESSFENFKVHIQQHKNFLENASAAPQQPEMAPEQAEGPPNLIGEQAGDDIAAGFGGLETPEAGRPPEIEGTGAFE
jgi:hypothetical protein